MEEDFKKFLEIVENVDVDIPLKEAIHFILDFFVCVLDNKKFFREDRNKIGEYQFQDFINSISLSLLSSMLHTFDKESGLELIKAIEDHAENLVDEEEIAAEA